MKPLTLMVWLGRAFMVWLLIAACYQEARAASGYQVVLLAYSTNGGRGLGTYVLTWRLHTVYPTYAECEAAGNKDFPGFSAPVRDDQSRLLPAFSCEEVR